MNNVSTEERIRELERKVDSLERENLQLKALLPFQVSEKDSSVGRNNSSSLVPVKRLTKDHVERYSRQLLLEDGFGVSGQCTLLSSSVLVVGAGGIGSTVLLYLASSGVGKITIVDFDDVEMSNLHRQVIHEACNVGMNKAESAQKAVLHLNPTIECEALAVPLDHENALELVQRHDCVVDASDNPYTRYLVNDACVLANKPLVSGSAVGTEAQLTVYNWLQGPCYRCLYPQHMSSSDSCQSCSDAGVLGPVPGLIGILQSMETIKILAGIGTTQHDRLLMYDSLRCSFMSVKKPGRSSKCMVCGPNPSILSMKDSYEDLRAARGPSVVKRQNGAERQISLSSSEPLQHDESANISCLDYRRKFQDGDKPHVLLDVRVSRQFEMCALPGAVNIPLARIPEALDRLTSLSEEGTKPIVCICRRGIASREASKILLNAKENGLCLVGEVKNILGGLNAWHDEVDSSFPRY